MTPQCEGCGRVRVHDEWGFHPEVFPDVMAWCPTCGAARKQEQERRWARECKRTAARAAKGYGPAPEGVDVFRGFREG